MVPPTTPFGIAVFKTVEDRGYGIQLVTGDLGADFLRYKAEHSQTENGILKAYSLSVGDNSVERQYAVFDGLTAPISPLTLRSNEAVEFEIDDSLFSVALDPGVSSLIRIANGVPEVIVHDDSHQHGSIFELPAGYEWFSEKRTK